MKLRMVLRMGLLAALVAASVSLPGTASARIVSVVWTCNSDGYEHVVVTNENGVSHEFISSKCGPIAFGGGFNLLLSEETRISERGQAFLDRMEAGEALPSTRVRDREAGTVDGPSADLETIHLQSDEVGPRLAAFFTRIDANWNANTETPSGECRGCIFDRWGQLVSGLVLVPGDMALTIPFPTAEVAERTNAKQACLDKQGFWRRDPAGAWGCWTTAR